jgi:putative heme-binding domain-containing protein
MRRVATIAVCLLAAGEALLAAQHVTRPVDLTEGAQIYRSTCALCHGLDGSRVSGVSLGSGQFRRASSDDDLIRIIREGIPDTAMPSNTFSDAEAATLVAYLRAMPTLAAVVPASSNVARGQAIFEGKGRCLTCHMVGKAGAKPGPDLTGIGRLRQRDELAVSIVDPDAEVLFAYRTFRGTTRAGTTMTGRVLNEDTFTVQIVTEDGRPVSLTKSDLQRYEFLKKSPMPSYRTTLTSEELSDLVAYLVSLRTF